MSFVSSGGDLKIPVRAPEIIAEFTRKQISWDYSSMVWVKGTGSERETLKVPGHRAWE